MVVVGETRRGKSSFVDALVGRPVAGAGTPTARHVVVRHAREPVAFAHRREHDPEPIEVAEVARWSGVSAPADDVVGVEVGVDHPLLARGLILVDTPGVGGLEAAHREVTLAAVARADALVFVLEADAPVSRTELAFLDEAAERVSHIVVVLAKVDATVGWEAVLAEDCALLGRHATAGILPISSHERMDELEAQDEDQAAESGFDAVERILSEHVVGRIHRLREANLGRRLRAELARLDEPEHAILAAEDASGLRRERDDSIEREREFASQADAALASLHLEFQRTVANPALRELRRRLRRLARRNEERIAARKLDLETLEAELPAEIQGLTAELQSSVHAGARALLQRTCDELGVAYDGAARLRSVSVPVELEDLDAEVSLTNEPWLARRMGDAGQVARTTYYARSLGLLLGPLGVIAGVAFGTAGWAGSAWMRRAARGGQETRTVLMRAIEALTSELDGSLRDELLHAQRVVQEELRSVVARRRGELRRIIEQQQDALRLGEQERQAMRGRAEARLAETAPLRRAVDTLERSAREEPGP